MAFAYMEMNRLDSSLYWFQRSRAGFDALGEIRADMVARLSGYIGWVEYRMKRYTESIADLKHLQILADRNPDLPAKYWVFAIIAGNWLKLGNADSALFWIDHATVAARSLPKDIPAEVRVLIRPHDILLETARIFAQYQRYDIATTYLDAYENAHRLYLQHRLETKATGL